MSAQKRSGRRAVLRGAGVALALPWLETLAPRPARGQAAAGPKRFLPIFLPCGAPEYWWPQAPGVGDAWQLSSVLEPLTALKEQVLLLGNVENATPFNADGSGSVEPSMGRLPGGFLTCVDGAKARRQFGVPDANGISVDQVLAQGRAGQTRLDSLQLGLSTTDSYCDGEPCSYSRSISWSTPTKPLYKLIDPGQVFDALYSDASAAPGSITNNRLNRSVLDAVLESSAALSGKLSAHDRQTLDKYLTSIRETEKAIVDLPACKLKPDRPTFAARVGLKNGQEGYDRGKHFDVMNDLIALAFQCDATRVISFMLDDSRSEFVYDHLAVRDFTPTTSVPGTSGALCGDYYGSGVNGDGTVYSTINWWLTLKVAELCQKLAAIPEAGGSVLDQTVIVYAAAMHGSNHSALNLPFALLGGRSMLKSNRFLNFASPQPMRDIYFTLLNGCFEQGVDSFGQNLKTGGAPQLLSELLA
ncbi:MAG TPA: DUF1552 domain-containing protein [Polyangiaceae bacterium]|nr:DUF1552 domain-containing protein [Polyangiaceae bacterium]